MRYKSVILIFTAFFIITLSLLLPACTRKTTTPDPLEYITLNSDCIIVGTITDQEYEILTTFDGTRTHRIPNTIFTVSIEKVIKGDVKGSKVLFRVEGGPIDDKGWLLPPKEYYGIGEKIIACLSDNCRGIYGSIVVPWYYSERGSTGAKREDIICRIINIMKKHKIPVSLAPDEIPCSFSRGNTPFYLLSCNLV